MVSNGSRMKREFHVRFYEQLRGKIPRLTLQTENGARRGDVIQSLLATCQKAGINCFGYLAWLQENKSQVKANPERFLPWCYNQQS